MVISNEGQLGHVAVKIDANGQIIVNLSGAKCLIVGKKAQGLVHWTHQAINEYGSITQDPREELLR